jgi:xanthine dehydrogenase accessory factor
MREILGSIQSWKKEGKKIAIATIVKADGSPMRPLGSKMTVTTDQQIAGSVTGGCIEGAVYEESQPVIASGAPKLLHYGIVSDQTPWEIGLSCGSSLTVLVESLQNPAWEGLFEAIEKAIENKEMLACATVISGEYLGRKMLVWPNGKTQGNLGSAELNHAVKTTTLHHIEIQDAAPVRIKLGEEITEVFIDLFVPPARLIIVGAAHIAIPMVTLAKTLGFTTLVVDPRAAFATRERFPDADELILEWPADAISRLAPDQGTSIAVVSHDEKFDNPALIAALKSQARYVGVLGTRRNVAKRLDALRELGATEEELLHLHAPIGLEIGAVEPEEIALAVLSEIVAVRHGLENHGTLKSKSIIEK